MPGWFRWIALACALFLTFDYFVGGWNSPTSWSGPGQGHFLYILGLVIVAAYVPLYWWRKIERPAAGASRPRTSAPGRRVRRAASTSDDMPGAARWSHGAPCRRMSTMQAETEL